MTASGTSQQGGPAAAQLQQGHPAAVGGGVADRLAAALPPGERGDFPITSLDRLGVPVVAADHAGPPRAGSFGYGETEEQARTGAYGELVEGLLLHHHLRALTPRRASYAELRAEGAVDPRELVLPAGTVVDDAQPRDWLPALRWRTGETAWLPAEFCASSGADVPWLTDPLITVITNGSGAGDTVERAVAHGLLELLQRDGNGTAFRALDRGAVLDLGPDDAAVADPVTRELLDRLRRAGIEVLPKLASTQFGLADVHVVGIDDDPAAEPLAVTACGEACHPDREVALRKAVLEYAAARSRKVFAHAPLDRLRPHAPADYWERELAAPVAPQEPRALAAMREWSRCSAADLRARLEPTVLSQRTTVAFTDLPATPVTGPADLLDLLLERLAGFDVLVVPAAGDGAVSAKVVVPGLEVETMSYGRIGARGVAELLEQDRGLVGLGAPPHPGAAPVVLTDRGRDELGADAWFDRALAGQIIGELYPLYREPSRHALARS